MSLSRFYEYAFVAVALAAIVFMTFGAVLSAGFVADDFVPLVNLFKLTDGQFVLNARECHLISLIFHVVNSFLVYCVCQRIYDLAERRKRHNAALANRTERRSFDKSTDSFACHAQKMVISLIVAIVFAVLPVQIIAIASAAAFPAIFGLSGYLLFLLYAFGTKRIRGIKILAATMLLAPLSWGYCLLLPCLWAALFTLRRRTPALSNIAQTAFLIAAIGFAFLARQSAQSTIVATKMLDAMKNRTADLVSNLPPDTSVALLNLPAGKKGLANFTGTGQLRAMLSPPFCLTGLASRVLWLDDNKSSDEKVDAKLLKELAGSRGRYQLAAWNDSKFNYDLLAVPSPTPVAPVALPVVSIGSFRNAVVPARKGWSLSRAFANREPGNDLNSLILPISEGISPFDYDILELSLSRSSDGGLEQLPAVADLSNENGSLSWSGQSYDETEHGEPIIFTVDGSKRNLDYRLPLANYKGWLISNRVRALRLDLPATMPDYSVKSAVLRRASAAEIAQAGTQPIDAAAIASTKFNLH